MSEARLRVSVHKERREGLSQWWAMSCILVVRFLEYFTLSPASVFES